eukprot:Skav223141  [mRNA]  locus=scaffold470:220693:225262:+ [translate_table: standard]
MWRASKAVCQVVHAGSTAVGVRVGANAATVHLSKEWAEQMTVGVVFTIQNFKLVWYEAELHFRCDQPDAIVLLHPSELRGELTIIEAFAGMGGWSHAAAVMNRDVRLMIEKDEATAKVCAKTFGCPVFTASEYIEKILKHEQILCCVINDTIENPKTWMAIALSNPEAILASPPCQPWSSAGNSQGLSADDGQAMLALLGWAGTICIPTVVVENVPGLRKHADYSTIIQEAKIDGMEPMLADVYQCAPVLPVKRERWLAAFVHHTVTVQAHRIQLAASISFTDHLFHAVCQSPSLRQADVMHQNMSDEERKELVVTQEMMDALGNPQYIPKWLKKDVKWNSTSDAIIEARTVKPHQQMGTIMALYGKQHQLSHELLQSRGLHTTLTEDASGRRLFSLWEIVAALGYPASTIMHCQLDKSFLLAGNGLSIAHAWLALYKVHVLLGPLSPFRPNGTQVDQVSQFLSNRINMSKFHTKREDDFWMLVQIESAEEEHTSKKPRVELAKTLAFAIDDTQLDTQSATRAFEVAPPFECCHDPRVIHVQGMDYADGLVVLTHVQNHWVMMINISKGQTVGYAIEKGLPHAKEAHFEMLQANGKEVTWDHCLRGDGQQRVVFSPTSFLVSCCEQTLHIALTLRCDVTWTVKNGKAYCASQMGCQIDSFDLLNEGKRVLEDDYMLEFQKHDFNIVFKTNVPNYVDVSRAAKSINDLDIRVAPSSYTRYFAKHPLKKTIRTIAMAVNCTFAQMMQELFPDMHASTAWSIYGEGQVIPKEAYTNAWKNFQIQWETMRPIPITEVTVIRFNTGLDSPVTQTQLALTGIKRWCRSPFAVKAVEMLLPPDMTIGELAATYMCHTIAQASMLCSVNGVLLEPEMKVGQTGEEVIIQTSICPLNGGAKHDGLKKRIKDMLAQKGVPDDLLNDRLAGFLAQCPMEKISVHKDNDDDQLWQNLKSLATTAKYRWIKPDELKAYQAKMKQSKPGSTAPVKKDFAKGKSSKPKNHHGPAAHEVVVDPSHFGADGDPVKILEFERFSSDQSGLCVATPQQAAQEDAPASHLAINQSIVITEKLYDNEEPKPPTLVATAREVRVDTIRDAGNNVVAISTSTRFAEMRAQIEEQVASVIDSRLAAANNQIQQLSQALQDVQRDNVADMQHLKTEQEHTKKKLNEMEQAVATSGQSIVKQMQQMFANMEQNLTAKMGTAVEGAVANLTPIDNPEKVRRKDKEDKNL